VVRIIDINEAIKLTDDAAIVEQIDIRRSIGRQMVGQLYPSILFDEIQRLERLRWDLRTTNEYGTRSTDTQQTNGAEPAEITPICDNSLCHNWSHSGCKRSNGCEWTTA